MRIVGAIFVVFAAVLFGQYWVSRLRAREDALGALLVLISRIQTELEYTAPPLECLLEIVEDKSFEFIGECRKRLEAGTNFPEAWSEAVERSAPQLNSDDKTMLSSFGRGLGATDIAGQSRTCKLYIQLFTKTQSDAAREREKYGAYLPKLSLLLGLCAAILLL